MIMDHVKAIAKPRKKSEATNRFAGQSAWKRRPTLKKAIPSHENQDRNALRYPVEEWSGYLGSSRGTLFGWKNHLNKSNGFVFGHENIIERAEGVLAGNQNICSRCKGMLLGVVNGALSHLKGASIGLVNYSEKLKGLQAGIINITDSASIGVQLGIFNFRMSGPWYARIIPVLAIRFAGASGKDERMDRFFDRVTKSNNADGMRCINRKGLIDYHKREEPEGFFNSLAGKHICLDDEQEVLVRLKLLAFEKGIAEEKRINELEKGLYLQWKQHRKNAGGILALIACDPKIYGKTGSLASLKVLIRAAEEYSNNEAMDALQGIGIGKDMLENMKK